MQNQGNTSQCFSWNSEVDVLEYLANFEEIFQSSSNVIKLSVFIDRRHFKSNNFIQISTSSLHENVYQIEKNPQEMLKKSFANFARHVYFPSYVTSNKQMQQLSHQSKGNGNIYAKRSLSDVQLILSSTKCNK